MCSLLRLRLRRIRRSRSAETGWIRCLEVLVNLWRDPDIVYHKDYDDLSRGVFLVLMPYGGCPTFSEGGGWMIR